MTVSEQDRARMRRLAADLDERRTWDRGPKEWRAQVLAWANERRARIGLPPLRDEVPPEEGLYERARSLGMARVDPRGPRRA